VGSCNSKKGPKDFFIRLPAKYWSRRDRQKPPFGARERLVARSGAVQNARAHRAQPEMHRQNIRTKAMTARCRRQGACAHICEQIQMQQKKTQTSNFEKVRTSPEWHPKASSLSLPAKHKIRPGALKNALASPRRGRPSCMVRSSLEPEESSCVILLLESFEAGTKAAE